MAEKLQKPEDDDLMASAGFNGNPSLYGEQQLIHDYSQMNISVLNEKAQRFISIIMDPETLPHHRAQYARLLDHIVYETSYREAQRTHEMGRIGIELLKTEESEL